MKKTASASRRRAYAKARRSSKCRTIKRSTVCKRDSKCKWAKGSKRAFCRNATNKKYGKK